MRVIDLLNKKANNEKMPLRVKFRGEVYELSQGINWYYDCTSRGDSLGSDSVYLYLNYELEIIEEDKEIEKWNYDKDCTDEWNFGEIKEKLDELVEAVNELKKGK